MLRGGWFEGCSACRVIKLLVSSIAIVTTVAFYSLSETVWWGKWRTAISIEPPLVFWTARLDGTREAVPRRPNGNPCGTGMLSDTTLETLSKDLPINPLTCKCDKIENTGGNFPVCCRRLHATLLRYIVNTLPKYHLTFWLDFGTLLGAVREGGFMLHDSDIDISLLVATVEDARNLDRFLTRATLDGFSVNSWYPREKTMNEAKNERGVRGWEALWTSLVAGNDMFAILAFGEHLDIYAYHPATCATCPRDRNENSTELAWDDGNGLIRPAEFLHCHEENVVNERKIQFYHPIKDIFPLSMNCNMQGWYLPCPRMYTKILERYYGEGTKILDAVHKHCPKSGCANNENIKSTQNRFDMAMECLQRSGSNSLFELKRNIIKTYDMIL